MIDDLKERKQALDRSRSFIVRAPAGSGKTELLIQRFLKLLGYVQQPEHILAMTFTRKAAGEMKIRIMKALDEARSEHPAEKDHEKITRDLARRVLIQNDKKKWRLLENPSRLKIQTIDSFCAELTRQMPLLSRLGASPKIEENANDLYHQAAISILNRVEVDGPMGDAVRTVLKHLDNSRSDVLQRIIQLLGKRDQWLLPFFDQWPSSELFRVKMEQTLTDLIEMKLQEVRDFFPANVARSLPTFASASGRYFQENQPDHILAHLNDLDSLPQATIEELNHWKALAQLLLTDQGQFRKTVNVKNGFPVDTEEEKSIKKDFSDLLEQISGNWQLEKALADVKKLPSSQLKEEEWNILQAIGDLLPQLEHILRDIFRENGKTDFTEISLSALKSLGKPDDPTDLLLKLDLKLQHILVDEYQDTSYKQFKLLELLTAGWEINDGRTLFVVGDPMQSIYRFRDAEVGLFVRTRIEGIRDIKLEPITLTTNFRSQKLVVEWVNECFHSLFPDRDEPDLGSIIYSPSKAVLPEETLPGAVLHPMDDSTGEQEAAEIATLVQDIRERYPEATVAILVRSKSHPRKIVRKFHELNIPFKAEEIDLLATRPAILDLLSLMRSLLSPMDRISWLAILRGPWCGLSLEDLHYLCHDDKQSSIWELLNDPQRVAGLSEEGKCRVQRLLPIMDEALRAKPTTNFRELLEGCWIALGGPACVQKTILRDVDVFFDKVSDVLQAGDLRKLRQFEKNLEDLYASPPTEIQKAVQIMTIHKAKGLEFDFVILPGLGRSPRPEGKRLVLWIPHRDELLLAPVQEKGGPQAEVYNFLTALDKEKEDLETLRLLYVAATRAKKQIHLFGAISNKPAKETRPRKTSLLYRLWPFIKNEWSQKLNPSGNPNPSRDASSGEKPAPSIHRLPDNFAYPVSHPAIDKALDVSCVSDTLTADPEFIWAGNRARCLGTVLHRCFKDMALEGLDAWTPERVEQLRPSLQAALLGEGLPDSELNQTVDEGIRGLINILEDKKGRWIMEPHREHGSEFPVTGVLQTHCVDRVIDRTFIDENDVRWIIDFKTGIHEGTNLEVYFQEERERYRKQMDEYEELLRLSGEPRIIKKALYYPLHKKFLEI